jgi:enoyl-CoA hydratase/carnithine racemase
VDERMTVTIDDHVADVRLNRPEKLNALDDAMFDALLSVGERMASEPGVRAVVLSGEGRGFCAGLDFGSFAAMTDDGGGPVGRLGETEGRITHRAQQAAWCWQQVPAPVIAALHGAVFGGGLQIALGADIRIVARDAQLSVAEVRWGLIPDMTGTVTLTRLMGVDVAKELALTGRAVDGEEAVSIGLATRLADDPRATALELARQIAGRSPDATRAIKRLFNRAARHLDDQVADQFAAERAEIAALIGSANQLEAVRASFEKREPVFSD